MLKDDLLLKKLKQFAMARLSSLRFPGWSSVTWLTECVSDKSFKYPLSYCLFLSLEKIGGRDHRSCDLHSAVTEGGYGGVLMPRRVK